MMIPPALFFGFGIGFKAFGTSPMEFRALFWL